MFYFYFFLKVPHDQPKWALDLLIRFVGNKPFGSGVQ
jgi:hypothetical protein